MDNNLRARHDKAQTISDLERFKGSKYVQSDIGYCFREIKEDLKNKKTVLFSGTPCQIYGLKQFLGQDYETLITVDFICHGVPSPMVWRRYLDYREKAVGSKAVKCSFRDKSQGWKNYSLSIAFENGNEYMNTITQDPFLSAFIYNIMLRDSCYNCRCKELGAASDITLGDFWGAEKCRLSIADKYGVSVVLINTNKGRHLYERVKDSVFDESVPLEILDMMNPSRTKQTESNPFRDYFLDVVSRKGFIAAYDQWVGDSVYAKLSRKLVTMLKSVK